MNVPPLKTKGKFALLSCGCHLITNFQAIFFVFSQLCFVYLENVATRRETQKGLSIGSKSLSKDI
jgi:hypothetical protein